jgi:hypothetical protein
VPQFSDAPFKISEFRAQGVYKSLSFLRHLNNASEFRGTESMPQFSDARASKRNAIRELPSKPECHTKKGTKNGILFTKEPK